MKNWSLEILGVIYSEEDNKQNSVDLVRLVYILASVQSCELQLKMRPYHRNGMKINKLWPLMSIDQKMTN